MERYGLLSFMSRKQQEKNAQEKRSRPSDITWITDSHWIQEELHEV
jgi:hypothetical protein